MAATLILAIIGLPWLGALAVWLIGDRRPRAQHTLAAVFSVAAGLAALLLLGYVSADVVMRIPMGNFFGDLTFVADGMGVFLAVVATVVGSLATIFSIDYMHGEDQLGRYYSFVLFFIGSMVGADQQPVLPVRLFDRRRGKIRSSALSHLAARCNGSAHPGQRLDP